MRNGRLLGPLFLLFGGLALALPDAPGLQPDLQLTATQAASGGLGMVLLALAVAALGWRGGWAALRQATGRSAGTGPAKRMKIRIRCAR